MLVYYRAWKGYQSERPSKLRPLLSILPIYGTKSTVLHVRVMLFNPLARPIKHSLTASPAQPPEFYVVNRLFFNRLSLYVNEHTALCARLSLGGVIETCRAVAEGRIANAFAIVR
jgi:hypothetical protein